MTYKKSNSFGNQMNKLSLFLHINTNWELASRMKINKENIFSDEEIIDGIKRGDPVIINHLRKHTIPFLKQRTKNLRKDHREYEIFQDALVILFKKLNTSGLILKCQFTTYFLAICKKVSANDINNLGNFHELLPESVCFSPEEHEEIENLYTESKEFQLYHKYFHKLKRRQQMILETSISGKSHKDLYQQFGFASADSFKNEICRIRKNLTNLIKSDPEYTKYKDKKNWSL